MTPNEAYKTTTTRGTEISDAVLLQARPTSGAQQVSGRLGPSSVQLHMSHKRLKEISRCADEIDRCVRVRGREKWATLGECDWLNELHRFLYEETDMVEATTQVDPNGKSAKEPGSKLDAGKSPILRGVLQYFPRAIKAVGLVSLFGATKYTWNGWEFVPDGIARYGDGLARHITAEATDGMRDLESNYLHAAHAAWNALARLELIERELESNQKGNSKQEANTTYHHTSPNARL